MTAPQAVEDPFSWAPVYRALGWEGTLPLRLGTKWPPPNGYTGHGAPWPSDLDVEGWACRPGAQNVALRLPEGIVALDVDDVGGLQALEARLGTLPPTWRSQGDPGRLGHLFYRLPAGVTSVGMHDPCAGVELLRHEHRYSVVAPSIHPDGHRYAWHGPDGSRGVPRPSELPELPGPWVAHLASPRHQESGDRLNADKESLSGEVGPVRKGGRDGDATSYAASLRRRGFTWDEAQAAMALRWERYEQPPGDHYELSTALAKLGSAYAKFEARIEPLDPTPFKVERLALAPEPTSLPPDLLLPEPIQARFPALDWEALWLEPEGEDWLLEPLVPARRGVALYSPPKLGKSLLLLELAVALSRGLPVLGMVPAEPIDVLYVDYENDPRGDIRGRLQSMGLGPSDLGRLHYLSYPSFGALDTAAGGALLVERAKAAGAHLVVIDTVSRTIQGEENSNDTWINFYRNTGLLLKEAGIAYVRLDHTGKDETKGMRGGSAKSSDVDAIWALSGEAPEFLLRCEDTRIFIPEDAKVIAFKRVTVPHLASERIAPPNRQDAELAMQCAIWILLDRIAEAEGSALEMSWPGKGAVTAITNRLHDGGLRGTKHAGFGKRLGDVLQARKNHRENVLPGAVPLPDWTEAHKEAAGALLGWAVGEC